MSHKKWTSSAPCVVWLLSTNMPLVMLALWSAVARDGPVGRFGQAEFTAYFLCALIVRLMTGAWVIWELNYEILEWRNSMDEHFNQDLNYSSTGVEY